ncbi:MAG: hypothetical protein ABIA63_00895 [bacterium]
MINNRVILIFIDGWGLAGEGNPENPFLKGSQPFINECLSRNCRAIDACMGVDGIPQSATGQTSLLTGENAQKILGFHLEGFPSKTLRTILQQKNIFKKLISMEFSCDFLNAYHPGFFKNAKSFWSCTTVAAMAAFNRVRTLDMLAEGKAVYQEITNQFLADRGFDVPVITPEKAAENLLTCSEDLNFALFEYFLTDHCGHRQDMNWAQKILSQLNIFIEEISKGLNPDRDLLIITSDHGNLEDLSIKSHTRNPVPLITIGNGAPNFRKNVENVSQIPDQVIKHLKNIL